MRVVGYTANLAKGLAPIEFVVRGFYPAPRLRIFYRTPLLPRTCTIAIFVGRRAHVGEQRWFFRDDNEWNTIAERLKQMPCPHCNAVGSLNRHGYLRGFDDSSPQRKPVRAHRIFCSNRNARPGCGRTFSVWHVDKIRRLKVTAGTLWKFLQRAVADGIAAAIRAVKCHLSDRTMQRVWQRFDLGQSKIRTALLERCKPPDLSASHRPVAQVLAHLHAAFPDADCPIAAYQHATKTFFV